MRSINEIVAAELGMYPKGGLAQNIFRAVYQNLRAHSLGRKGAEVMTADTVRHRAIDLVRIHFPDFKPEYALDMVKSTWA